MTQDSDIHEERSEPIAYATLQVFKHVIVWVNAHVNFRALRTNYSYIWREGCRKFLAVSILRQKIVNMFGNQGFHFGTKELLHYKTTLVFLFNTMQELCHTMSHIGPSRKLHKKLVPCTALGIKEAK